MRSQRQSHFALRVSAYGGGGEGVCEADGVLLGVDKLMFVVEIYIFLEFSGLHSSITYCKQLHGHDAFQ
jgi:hypothetical protein